MPDLLFLGLALVVIGVELVKTTSNNAAIIDNVIVLFIIYLVKNQLVTNKNAPLVGEGKYTPFFEIINAFRQSSGISSQGTEVEEEERVNGVKEVKEEWRRRGEEERSEKLEVRS